MFRLALDEGPGLAALLPGEFLVYNCTNEYQPVTDTGGFFSLECRPDGQLYPPGAGSWPVCRELSPCNVSEAPAAPPNTHLLPDPPADPVQELDTLPYRCLANENKTYIADNPANEFKLGCLPGAVWQQPAEADWPVCDDPTTTTAAPTTSQPPRKKDCYCLGDIEADRYDPWRMTKERHKAILAVCRDAWVTFHEVRTAKDEGGKYNILPIKEQCGVRDPYVNSYGALAGTMRNYTYHDTCACVKDPLDKNAVAVEVVGYWLTVELLSLKWDPAGMGISVRAGRSEASLSKKGNFTARYMEQLFDEMFIEEGALVPERYIRSRFIKFSVGPSILNQEDLDAELATDEERSTLITMEAQFAQPEGKVVMELSKFQEVLAGLLGENETLSVEPMPYFQAVGYQGIVVNNSCEERDCRVREAPTCVNEDFVGIPSHLIFQHKNNTKLDFPYNVSKIVDGVKVTSLYVGKVGETLDFVCRADKKVFQTEDPKLTDNVLTVVCKTDRYYTVPSSGNWPVCKAQCDNNIVKTKIPSEESKLMLWEEHPEMVGKLDSLWWEEQRVWYKCVDEANEGIILDVARPGQVQYGDKRKTFLEYKCLDNGEFNLPIAQFPGCAPKREFSTFMSTAILT